MQQYFKKIAEDVKKTYDVANLARAKNLDPADHVEVPLASSLAEKAVGLIATIYPQLDQKVIARILELEKEYGSLDPCVSFKIAEEIAKEKFCKFKDLMEGIDAGIRVGFAYNTLGVVSSPIEGYTGLKLGKTAEGKDYFRAFFSGPIRSAGTTASCVALMLIDYLRETFGFAKYDPAEHEVKRYVIENHDYHTRVTNLQYLPTEEEIEFLARHIPIQIDGEPTEDREVSNYKDLARVDTNFIRGGMCLIFSEGLAQKAQKGFRLLSRVKSKGFQATGWDFLDKYIELHKKREAGKGEVTATYINDLVAGRPVFSHPSRSGGFRFRYGRSRVSGFSAMSVHPATMAITDCFLSTGTQMKIEKPTKGCVVTCCEEMDGPIVKLKNGSVKKLKTFEDARKAYPETAEIIYLGDLLVSLGDVINRNSMLLKSGYVEEWWELELKKENQDEKINKFDVSLDQAINLSEKYKIPLHPSYIFYWTQIKYDVFLSLLEWLSHSRIADGKLILPYNKSEQERFANAKRALEILGVEHDIATENVVLSEENTRAFMLNLGIDVKSYTGDKLKSEIEKILLIIKPEEEVLGNINHLSKIRIKDKAGTFIGARMGRPEKAKPRELKGSPHVLFPVGEEGGRLRSFQAALEKGSVKSDFPLNFCEKCNKESVYHICDFCGNKTKPLYYCSSCNTKSSSPFCDLHGDLKLYSNQRINIKEYYENALKKAKLGGNLKIVKGIKGTSSQTHMTEHLSKGILRATFNLHVNKDGTIRYDVTELPITHFKPKEIRTSVEKLKELGYKKDIYGKDLENEDQILELMPQDIILPSCPDPDAKDEKADDVFLNVTRFIDMMLVNVYGLEPFYKIDKNEDLVGQLSVCMAPHNCAGVISRIIGFSKVQGLMASPYIHAAVRRDCDGDEVAVMLLLDVLINFSRSFLPAHRGGTQDAPLILNARINAGEVDDQILDLEVGPYPLELYYFAEQGKHSSEVNVENVRKRLKSGEDPFTNIHFTHNTPDFNHGCINSSYKILPTMQEKVMKQMHVSEIIRAVDASDVARLVIERHFIRDIKGNFNKFTQQQFRCVECNEKYRRPPLAGKCIRIMNDGNLCGGKILFTITEGSIIKYLEPALMLSKRFDLSPYLRQSLDIVRQSIESVFGKETEKQQELKKWF